MTRHRLPVAVIGGGSAGISAVAALAGSGKRQVVWYDVPTHQTQSAFAVGELQAYRDVPANTKVDKLLGAGCFGHAILSPWIAASKPARAALQQLRDQAETILELEPYDPSPEGWVGLDACRAVYASISEMLTTSEHVTCIPARVTQVHYVSGLPTGATSGTNDGQWSVHTEEAQFPEMKVSALVLATGGKPRALNPAPFSSDLAAGTGCITEIPLRTALDCAQLRRALGSAAPVVSSKVAGADPCVAIIGNSHTGVVIFDHCRSIGVKAFLIGRRPIRHAEWVPEESDYRYTMSGLKGKGSAVGRWLDGQTHTQALTATTDQELQECLASTGCTHVVQAVGFEGSTLPSLTIDSVPVPWSAETLVRAIGTSQLHLPGLNNSATKASLASTSSDLGGGEERMPLVQLQRVYGLGLCFPEDKGFCKPSPDERPTGFSFANSCASRLVADLDRLDCANHAPAKL